MESSSPFPLHYELTAAQIDTAREIIAPHLHRTPLQRCPALDARAGGRPVWLKLETMQRTGSFKVRGALVRLAQLEGEATRKGVVAASAGNHGLGVAWACRALGIPGLVLLPHGASPAKVQALQQMAIKVRFAGSCYDEAEAEARKVAVEADATFISPFDDPWVMAGNGGTVGREIAEDLPEVATVVCPLGGGGLAAGLGAALPGVAVVGVNTDASPAMARSLAEGQVHLTYAAAPTIADGLEGGVTPGSAALCARLLHHVAVVPEAAFRRAVAWAARELTMVVEGSAAAPLAALLHGSALPGEGPICLVITGRNIDPALLKTLVQETGA